MTRGAHILVVDDNDSGRYVTAHTLRLAGYTLSEARSGAEALAAASTELTGPDLIVLDINLPDTDGFSLCRRLKATEGLFQVPILMASASYRTAENTAHGLDVGADAYLAHPIDPAVLVATVGALLRVRAAELETRRLNSTLEERVSERTAELEHVNRELTAANEELKAFASSASHDLRTPVRHVKGFAELARRALDAGQMELATQHMQVVERAAERMASLLDGMLRLALMERHDLHPTSVDLNSLVDTALNDLITERQGRQIELHVSALGQVRGDWSSLQQVVSNLLGNAVKYTRARPQAVIEVWAETQAGHVTVFVRDNGAGFDERYQARLFGMFQRLHSEREFEGIGVGLAIVRRIVLRHGGSVAAQGQPGEGATFSFTLPA